MGSDRVDTWFEGQPDSTDIGIRVPQHCQPITPNAG